MGRDADLVPVAPLDQREVAEAGHAGVVRAALVQQGGVVAQEVVERVTRREGRAAVERPVARDEETLGVVFDAIAQSADPRPVPDGVTVQWDFTDAEPWHVVVANGATGAARGRAAAPDVTMRMTLDDFGDIIAERADPRRLLHKRRVRVRGNPRLLLKLPRVFG